MRTVQPLAVLVVSPSPQSAATVSGMLQGISIDVLRSRDCGTAFARIASSKVSVVICDAVLPDGTWKDVIEFMWRVESSSVLIVTSELADEYLWAEVLNLGGYDVLAQPFDRAEVTRVVTSALGRLLVSPGGARS